MDAFKAYPHTCLTRRQRGPEDLRLLIDGEFSDLSLVELYEKIINNLIWLGTWSVAFIPDRI